MTSITVLPKTIPGSRRIAVFLPFKGQPARYIDDDITILYSLEKILDHRPAWSMLEYLHHDFNEFFNAVCALHDIPLITDDRDDDIYDDIEPDGTYAYKLPKSVAVIYKHSYAMQDQNMQAILAHLRSVILDPHTPNHVSVRTYVDVLQHMCDSYNFDVCSNIHAAANYVRKLASEAHNDQFNAGMHATSNMLKFIAALGDAPAAKTTTEILSALVSKIKDPVLMETQEYKDALVAIKASR